MSAASLATAQIRSALWDRQGGRVHAVVDGSVIAGLPERLRNSQSVGWDCLQRGALTADAAAQAAYIVELLPEGDLTAWLIGEASTAFEGWGVFITSTRTLLAMREHSRELAEVRTPEGRRRPWRWWDHELLDELLPSLSPSQLDHFFAADQQVIRPRAQHWIWSQRVNGVLDQRVRERVA